MFAKYNDNLYFYVANKRKKEIITRNPRKVNEDFRRDGNVFYKSVSENELIDIFNVELWVDFNTGLPNTPFHWQVGFDGRDYVNGKVLLRFSEGILPGWTTEEKNVCTKYIAINEIEGAKIVYLYKKRNAIACEPPQRVENIISISEIMDLFEQYKKSNV